MIFTKARATIRAILGTIGKLVSFKFLDAQREYGGEMLKAGPQLAPRMMRFLGCRLLASEHIDPAHNNGQPYYMERLSRISPVTSS
ncbi:hypothetical protein QFC20_006526 [Naganishia adeliensis]|uniref:Uncharacterized protein n=1 Tax=Naganishia adeliensis TaxID=92952 RepID=A0ACC2VAH7_9TREE|nr:hypothetical protein QFC20_006526 [Naganishia adeliensis]